MHDAGPLLASDSREAAHRREARCTTVPEVTPAPGWTTPAGLSDDEQMVVLAQDGERYVLRDQRGLRGAGVRTSIRHPSFARTEAFAGAPATATFPSSMSAWIRDRENWGSRAARS
jgi:hypothetical protein